VIRWACCCVALAIVGCGYWSAQATGDVAPTAWGQVGNPPTAAPASDVKADTSVEERLQNLKQLHDDGLISDAEYRERRFKVLTDSF